MTPMADLTARNTLGFTVTANHAVSIEHPDEIAPALAQAKASNEKWQVLGGGSNTVLPNQLDGLTMLMDIQGIAILNSDSDSDSISTQIEVGAGVNWHELVQWTLQNDLPGLENLALIPGTVGAAPIQNIGAYGVEIKSFIQEVQAYDTKNEKWVSLNNQDCAFSYRHSVFKNDLSRYIISKVIFALPKQWTPRIGYADLQQYFAGQATDTMTPHAIFSAVCAIRQRKLPDPRLLGNVGSFFQNPIISNESLKKLQQQYPQIVAYREGADQHKLAAGWLIDACGLKGYRHQHVGVHDQHALVLVHYGGGDARELLELANLIQAKVFERFGIQLQIEPIIF